MPFPLVPILIGIGTGSVAGIALRNNRKRNPRGMTPERQQIYEAALTSLKDPDKLRELADAFHGEECYPQADLLRKRAALKELPDEEKKKNSVRFKEAMASKDPAFVERVAKEHEQRGATSAAFNLRRYAKGLSKS